MPMINLAVTEEAAKRLENRRQKLGYGTKQEVIRQLIAENLTPTNP